MHTSFIIFIVIINLKYKSCSLLSRLKNRYEYLPQANIVDNFTEDLYDFEFITIEPTVKTSSFKTKTVIENDIAERDIYYISPRKPSWKQNEQISFIKNINERPHVDYDEPTLLSRPTLKTSSFNTVNKIYSTEGEDFYRITQGESNHKHFDAIPSTKILHERTSDVSHQPFFLPRLTLKNSVKSTKTWPTYFPIHTRETLATYEYFLRKPLLRILEIGETKTTKGIERNSLDSRTTPSITNTLKYTNIAKYIFNTTSSSNIPTTATYSNLLISEDTINNTDSYPFDDLVQNDTVSYCYRCGLNESRIPTDFCYNTFEGGDRRFGTQRHLFKMKCIRSEKVSEEKNIAYGPSYRRGCFKRFLDVGTEYNERGCRRDLPVRGKSFASIRFARMEYLLKHVEDGCVFSPHASITPFSRAISLFVRYHVCVCSQKYCNRAFTIKQDLNAASFFVTMFLFIVKI